MATKKSGEETQVNLRVPADLLRAFSEACADHDLTVSQVIRRCMRQYVDANRQGDLLAQSKRRKK